MSEQNRAAELAKELDRIGVGHIALRQTNICYSAAAELRLLVAENAALRAQLSQCEPVAYRITVNEFGEIKHRRTHHADRDGKDKALGRAIESQKQFSAMGYPAVIEALYSAPQQAPANSDVLAAANKLVLKAGYPSGTNLADALYELAPQQAPVDEREVGDK